MDFDKFANKNIQTHLKPLDIFIYQSCENDVFDKQDNVFHVRNIFITITFTNLKLMFLLQESKKNNP